MANADTADTGAQLAVVAPHGDPTLSWEAPRGWTVCDLHRQAVAHRLRPDIAAGVADGLGRDAEGRSRALLLRAAAQVLARRGATHPHQRMWALGAVLEVTTATAPVRLRLDDLELESGSTERCADVAKLDPQRMPWHHELCAAVPAVRAARRLRLWLDRDQQLPGVLTLLRAAAPHGQVELAGPFATTHRDALGRCDRLAGATVAAWPAEASLHAVVSGLPDLTAPHAPPPVSTPVWRGSTATPPPRGPRPWAGYVTCTEFTDPQHLLDTGCTTAVVAVCAADGQVLGADGATVERDIWLRSVDRLRAAGVRVVAEWWLGAPGVDETALGRTLDELIGGAVDWVAGLRRFVLTIGAPLDRWRERGVAPRTAGTGFHAEGTAGDLARTVPFTAPRTLSDAKLAQAHEALAGSLRQRAELAPGRVAAAYLAGPRPRPAAGRRLRLDDDATVVAGGHDERWYAVNLRTRAIVALDPRVGAALRDLHAPRAPGDLFASLPPGSQAKLARALTTRTILSEVL